MSNTIKNWVLTVVRNAVNLLSRDLQDATGWLAGVVSVLWQGLTDELGIVHNYVDSVFDWAQGEVTALAGLAARLYHTAVSYAEALYNRAIGAARGFVGDLARWATAALHFVESEARQWVTDLAHWTEAAVGYAEHAADYALRVALHAVEGWIADAWRSVYSAVKHDFINPIEQVLHWVRLAWDWVIWFAEHPFKVVHDVENDVINWADHLPGEIGQAVKGRAFMEGVDAMGKFLGG